MIGATMATRRKQITLPKMAATGSPKTEAAIVASPTVPGAVDHVQRVADTLLGLYRRKQIDDGEYQAGEKYRTAYGRLYSVLGGTMDFERARGAGKPSLGPADSYLNASEAVSKVRSGLYPKDFAIVYRVCALGMSIEEAAFNLPDQFERDNSGRPTRTAKEECGRRLRSGLAEMRDWWFPKGAGTGSKIRGFVHERAQATEATEVPRASQVVHATSRKVFRSGGK
jgi:hypothetical protein